MSKVPVPLSKWWLRRQLTRAKKYELHKINWKIFLMERRNIDDAHVRNVKLKVSEACERFISLQSVCVPTLATDLQDRDIFYKLCDNITQDTRDHPEEDKLCLIKSKLFIRTLRALQNYHSHKKSTRNYRTIVELSTPSSPSFQDVITKTRIKTQRPIKQQTSGHVTQRAVSVPGRGFDQPPTRLDSLFIGSLSGKATATKQNKQKTKPKTKPKNRVGQRSRRQLAEKSHGSAANHLKTDKKKGQRSNDAKSNTKRWTKNENTPTNKFSLQGGASSKQSVAQPSVQSDHSTEKLHPSWVASKKRKELQSKIETPQGQRIVFDSD